MRLFINTGGKGTRLYPLTIDIPKPMVQVAGKPLLHHLVDWAKRQGVQEIVMMNGHLAEKIVEYFKGGNELGVSIIHSIEPYPLGSGGPIKFARQHINGRFTLISGDVLCDVNLKKMESFHERQKAHITALVHPSSHPHDSDILQTNEEGKVIRFISKHDDHTNAGNLSNAGLCIIEPEVLDLMHEDSFNFENYLYPRLLEANMNFFAYNTDELMHDVGTHERLKEAEEYLKKRTH